MTEERGRQSRQDEVRQERRRRDDTTLDGGQAHKLAIPADIKARLAAQGRTARWINDVGSRVEDLTVRDDWDVVEGVEPREVVIDRKAGTTAKTILVSKPNAFIAQDAAKREAGRRERETAMLKGEVPGNPTPPTGTYADTANKIERGNQIL
jgi:hypothetical protein